MESQHLAERWFRPLKRHASPFVRLLCFPHTGGAASFYRQWSDLVPDGVELMAVRFPGREDRFAEPFARDIAELADPVAQACRGLGDVPLALFGHSMGASVAHEVAMRLNRDGRLAALFVSGRAGPGRQQTSNLAEASDEELIKDISGLGGTSEEAFEDPELRELLLPPIRADYRITYHYVPSSGTPLSVPVTAYYGTEDKSAPEDAVQAWAPVTRAAFSTRSFPGNHFHLVDQLQPLIGDIFQRLDRLCGHSRSIA
ncbi:alpha/beta fold hydrolase [Streptomyces sp. NPDC005322]|uniref:thioesterase II family protein n=1 Tax=Streptomyces sp. NPDC005322 TaxID=3157032 RepID=UPI0033BB70CC